MAEPHIADRIMARAQLECLIEEAAERLKERYALNDMTGCGLVSDELVRLGMQLYDACPSPRTAGYLSKLALSNQRIRMAQILDVDDEDDDAGESNGVSR